MNFREELIGILVKETKLHPEEISQLLSIPPNPALGDFAFPCFKLGKNPKEEAEKLQRKIELPKFISKVEVKSPYLNFFLKEEVVAEDILSTILKEKQNFGKGKQKKNVVVEYCGPNTNKPLHLGHLRNMSIGNSICRILEFQGNKVHPVNIVNDRGIHICQSLLAYQKWGKGKKPDKKGDHFVGDYYVLFAQKVKDDENLKKEAQELLLKWEHKDKEVIDLWKKMSKWVLEGFIETYKRFGISFEKEYFESAYYEKGKEIVQEGLKKGIFQKDDEGAILAPLENFSLPNKVLLRGDGTSVYITQDLYLADLRFKDFKFDSMIYVVASEQYLHFKQLFKILELLKRPYAKNMHHFSYGLVNLPMGRMKSREGMVVDADDIMDEIAAMAEKEIRQRHKDLSAKEVKQRADEIALAAIKFYMVKTDPIRDIVFNPEESISFEGETGPYLQYTHARACSIIRKAGKVSGKVDYFLLKESQDQRIIKLLLQFPEKVEESVQYKIHVLCHYLLDLAQAFNEFYHQFPVISDDKELMKARLQLVMGVKQVLYNGLNLLGIKALEEM